MEECMSYSLPDLPFPKEALEPNIDTRTMEIHHDKHHAGYVKKLNDALTKAPELESLGLIEILSDLSKVPESVRTAVQNNGGGHFNHSLFWKILSPEKTEPQGEVLEGINSQFGGIEGLKKEFNAAAATRFGSGWAWLGLDGNSKLVVLSTANQDTPLAQGISPILGLDVWEHAYYLKYQNRRPDYIEAFWNVVNWNQVAENMKGGFKI